jgi:hypothetical protein
MEDVRLGQKVSFLNPVIQAQLVTTPTKSLYPKNDDVFIEFVEGTVPSDIHLNLTETQQKVTNDGELRLFSLELIHERKTVVRLHAEESMILFIQFVLTHQPIVDRRLLSINLCSQVPLRPKGFRFMICKPQYI